MASKGGINGIALAAIGFGGVFCFAGIKGYSVTHTLQILITGKSPGNQTQTSPIGTPTVTSGNTGGMGGGGGDPAGISQSYVGKLKYVFGGPPPPGTVDCSSFASKCLSEAGIPNPGGAPYSANSHGPNTISYLSWKGAVTVGHSPSDAQRNDLCVWQTHMGIALGNGQFVSARDPAEGVGVDSIAGDVPGELLFVRRLVAMQTAGSRGA
jgi:cell wall-associated NlpC family hydrolase